MGDEPNVLKLSVYNSVAGRKFDLFVREDRYTAFQTFVLHRRWRGEYAPPEAPVMPGISWAAYLGLDAVFDRRPKSFPAHDIIRHFAADIPVDGGPVTPHEVETALEQFSSLYPPDVSESA